VHRTALTTADIAARLNFISVDFGRGTQKQTNFATDHDFI